MGPKIDTESIRISPHSLAQSFITAEGKVFLLYGDPLAFRFSLLLAAQLLRGGASLPLIDGCNRFDVHTITRFARERRLDADALLRRIYVSRGFTCYQMEAAVSDRLPAFLRRINSKTALIFGLLDTFYDEQVPLREVRQMLRRVLGTLAAMKQDNCSLLLTCTEWDVRPEERNELFTRLKAGMDRVYHVMPVAGIATPQLFLEPQRHSIPQKGASGYGTDRTDVHEHHRQRARIVVEIPPRPPQGGPGTVR